jgi:hypothetical protein
VVGGVGVFPFEPRLVWLAAGQSDDRCVKNGNSDFAFAHCARKSGTTVGSSLHVIPRVAEGSRDETLKVTHQDPSTLLGMTLLQYVHLIDQAFAEVGAEQNFIRSDLNRLSAWFQEILLRKHF